MQRILITGGPGFVGSNLSLALRAAMPEASITAMDNLYRSGSKLNVTRLEAAGIRFHQGDVRHPDSFPNEPFDLMIECSAGPPSSPGAMAPRTTSSRPTSSAPTTASKPAANTRPA